MIPAPLLTHRATVWRKSEKRGTGGLRETIRSWTKVEGAKRVGLILKVNHERRGDTGGGERTEGEYEGICNGGVDIVEGDVLEVYSGQMSPLNLKVDEKDQPADIALVLVPFVGKLAS